MASEKLSNVIGAPFSEYVLTQLNLRAFHNSTIDRTPEEILFLANKSAWVKLTSSVKIVNDPKNFYKLLELDESYSDPEDLAKRWVLEAGTSVANGDGIELRKGLGIEGAYGLGGILELGYRPMPGLTSVTIDTKGTLGSLREATINFKVWNMNQLNIIEALYFRLGYSMLLEWGHTQFYTNTNRDGVQGTFSSNSYGINPFVSNLRKENVQQQINKQGYSLSGNYDGMLGIVSNFHWAFNQEGGYDCSVRLVGLGAIIDTIRTNLSYKMPNTIFQKFTSQQETFQAEQEMLAERKRQEQLDKERAATGKPPLVAAATDKEGIKAIIASDKGVNVFSGVNAPSPISATDPTNGAPTYISNVNDAELANYSIPIAYSTTGINVVADYYYKAEKGGKESSKAYKDELNSIRTGLFLNPIPNVRSTLQVAYVTGEKDIVLSKNLVNSFTTLALTQERVKTTFSGRAETITDISKFDVGVGNDIFDRLVGYNLKEGSNSNELNFTYQVQIQNAKTGKQEPKTFSIGIIYKPLPGNDLTYEELTNALSRWFTQTRKVRVTSIDFSNGTVSNPVITGVLQDVVLLGKTNKKNPTFTIKFDNTALIESVTNVQTNPAPSRTPTGLAATGDADGVDNVATDPQVDTAVKFASSLHAMLAAAKSQIQFSVTRDKAQTVSKVPLKDLTEAFYRDGVLEGIFNIQADPNITKFDLKQYALRGFNSYLMANPDLLFATPTVDFEELATGYAIEYTIQDTQQNTINFPTYIKFGYLMAFLNNMCLIYDSTQNTDKHPYVYLDFNPDTNFCLTMPQHLSIDPFTCMIPFEGTTEDYLSLFPPDLVPKSTTDNSIFNTNINAVSSYLPKFKGENPYQGRIMDILLNIDFLTDTVNQYTTQNTENIINLKGFLDAIVDGINKATGNLNLFRVSYRDDSNTVVIRDDQFTPRRKDESWMLDTNAQPTKYSVEGGVKVNKYGELPVFGKQSLIRAMQFETNLSTNMSNVIAISAQSNTKAVNSTDHSSFSYLNRHFEDRYKPVISDSSENVSKANKKDKKEQDGIITQDLNNATQFNAHVISVYYGGSPLARKKVPFATNYYINSMAGVKSTNDITIGSPIIPANLNITMDGVSGIVMGNAFTIPEDRLPASLRGDGGFVKNAKVGFVVVGLTHTIQNNEWLTQIRGQMIRLRDNTGYGKTVALKTINPAFPATALQSSPAPAVDISSINLNQSWIQIAFQFISGKERFREVAYYDVNAFRVGYGSDNVYPPPDANGISRPFVVTSTTTVTLADAKRTLEYRIQEFANTVIRQIGQRNWDKLKDSQKAALVSYAYNRGSLSSYIVKAIVANNSVATVAQFIRDGVATAGGVFVQGLKDRRAEEAQLYSS
jgi:GH24 family phage-related lysozyme (muramidase)